MRTSVDPSSVARRGEAEAKPSVTQAGTPSSDPARYALSAIRAAVGRSQNAALAAAARDLAARVHDPAHEQEEEQVGDDTQLSGNVIELPPVVITATPLDESGLADPAGDQDPTAARLASIAGKLSYLHGVLADGRDLQVPETWILATAVADLLGLESPEDAARAAAASEHDRGKPPDFDAQQPKPDDPLNSGMTPHDAAARQRSDDPTERKRKADNLADQRVQQDKERALQRGPTKQKGKARKEGQKPGASNAKPKKTPDGKKPPGSAHIEKPTGGEASGGAAVGAWKAKVDAKVGTVKAKPISDGQRYVATITEAAPGPPQTDSKKLELIAEARKAVTPVENFKESPELKALPKDPVPDARDAVDKWCNQKIVKQTMPELQQSPLGRWPEIGTSAYTDKQGKAHVMREISPGKYGEIIILGPNDKPPRWEPNQDIRHFDLPSSKGKDAKDTGSLADKIKEHNAKDPKILKPPAPKVIGAKANDDFPLKAPIVPQLDGLPKIDIAAVLQSLLSDVDGNTVKIRTAAGERFPGYQGLAKSGGVPGYTAEWHAELKADVVKEFQTIAEAGKSTNTGLKTKLEGERNKAEQEVKNAAEQVKDAKLLTKTDNKTAYEVVGGYIGGLRDQLDKEAEERALMANKQVDGAKARKDRDDGKKANQDKVEIWLGRYKKMKERRIEQLGTAQGEQENAYKAAYELDVMTLKATLGEKPTPERQKEHDDQLEKLRLWKQDVIQGTKTGLNAKFSALTEEVKASVDEITENLKSAGEAYDKAADEWYRKLIGFEKSFWSKVLDFVMDWLGVAKKESKVWKERSDEDNYANLQTDELWLKELQITHHGELTKEELDCMGGLSEEQREIAKTYFIDTKKDGAAALARGLIVRLGKQWGPRIAQRIEQKVLKDSYEVLVAVANSSGMDNTVDGKCKDLHKAFTGPGTKKEIIWTALGGLTAIQARAVEMHYERTYHYPLRAELQEELYDLGEVLFGSTHDADRAKALLDGARSHYDKDDPDKVDKAQMEAIAIQLDATMKATFLGTGAGTDEKELLKLLRGKTPQQIAEIKRVYQKRYGRDLTATIKDELLDGTSPPWNWQEALALLENRPEDAEAAALRASMGHVPGMRPKKYGIAGGLIGFAASPWLEKAGVPLDDDTIVNYFTRDQADAEDAMARVKAEVVKDQQKYGWNDKDFKRQLDMRLKAVDEKFGTKYGSDFGGIDPSQSALSVGFGKSFSADQAKLLDGIRTQNLAMESAARVAIERKAIFSSKEKVDKALADQYVREFEAQRRDVEAATRKEKEEGWKNTTVYVLDSKGDKIKDEWGREKVDWNATRAAQQAWRKKWVEGDAVALRRREDDRKAEKLAADKAPENMRALKAMYEDKSMGFVTGGLFAFGNFERDVYSATNLSWAGIRSTFGGEARTVDSDKTMALLASGGYLTPDQQIFFGVYGVGTDDDAVKKAYAGRSIEEINEIHRKLAERLRKKGIDCNNAEDAAAWVKDDFSGRDLKDVKLLMEHGEPITLDEKRAMRARQVQLEEEGTGPGVGDYILGTLIGGPILGAPIAEGFASLRKSMGSQELEDAKAALKDLDAEIAALAEDKKRLKAEGIEEGDAAYYDKLAWRLQRIDAISNSVNSNIEARRASIDALADWVTIGIQVVMIAGAVVIGAIVTAVTAGAASPAVVAALTALITAVVTSALTIAAKVIIKGGDYGWEEFAQDLAMAAVEAVLAAATANISTALLKSGSILGKMAAKGAVAKFIAEGIAGTIEGVVQSTGSALFGQAMQGHFDLNEFLGQIGQGAAMAGAMHMAKPILNPVLGRLGDALNRRLGPRPTKEIASYRGSQQHIDETFKQYQKEKPGATKTEFLKELDNVMLQRHASAFADPQTQAILRADLMEGLPGPVRQKYAGAKIEMVTDADFNKKFGSGDAHVMVGKNGEPVVVVRAGTDLGALGSKTPHIFEAPATPKPHPSTGAPEVTQPKARTHAPDVEVDVHGTKVKPPPEHVVMEPMVGPSFDSPLEIAAKKPGTKVIATESMFRPTPEDIASFKQKGHEFHGENQPQAVPHNSVDEIKMRFPLPSSEAERVTFLQHLANVRSEFPDLHPVKQSELALKRVESVQAHGPYALERLKPGGHMEVVYWEKEIGGDINKLKDLTYRDPVTGKTYKFEVEPTRMVPKNEVAPHSGFMVPLKPGENVHVVVVRKVEVDLETHTTTKTTPHSGDPPPTTKKPTARPDVEIESEQAESRAGRGKEKVIAGEPEPTTAPSRRPPPTPDVEPTEGPIRRIREQEAPLGSRAEAAAQAEKGRCAAWVLVEVMRNLGWTGAVADQPGWHPAVDQKGRGFGDIVRALKDPSGNKLPRIKGEPSELMAQAATMKPGTQIVISAKTKNGVWHAMLGVVQPDGSLELTHVSRASTVKEQMTEFKKGSGLMPDPGGNVMVTTRIYDAQVPELANFNNHRWWVLPDLPHAPTRAKLQSDAPNMARLLPEGERLPPRVRKSLEADLIETGATKSKLGELDDNALLQAHHKAQAELAPKRIAEFRETLPWHAKGELDSLTGDPSLHTKAVTPDTQSRLQKALGTPVVVNNALPPGEVQVKYKVGKLGNVVGLELHLGPGATVGDALLHVGTLHSFKRYQGVTGVLRNVTDSLGRLLGSGKLPLGSRAHEAWKELKKLPAVVETRRLRLADKSLDIHTRVKLEMEIEALERQIAKHVGELGDLTSKGRGYVASQGTEKTAHHRLSDPAELKDLKDKLAAIRARSQDIHGAKLVADELEAVAKFREQPTPAKGERAVAFEAPTAKRVIAEGEGARKSKTPIEGYHPPLEVGPTKARVSLEEKTLVNRFVSPGETYLEMLENLPKLAKAAGLEPAEILEHMQRLMYGLGPEGVDLLGKLAAAGEGGWFPRGIDPSNPRLPILADPSAYAALKGKQERIQFVSGAREKADIMLAYMKSLSSAEVISLGVEPGRVPTHFVDLYLAMKTGDLSWFARTPAAAPTIKGVTGPAEAWRQLDRIFTGDRRVPKAGTALDKGLTEMLARYDALYKGKALPSLDELHRFFFNQAIPLVKP